MAIATPVSTRRKDARLTLADMRELQAYDLIMGLDLTSIADEVRSMGEIDEELLSMALGEYRRFLILRLAGYVGLAVPRLIADIWHGHQLHNTLAYVQFCDMTFGSLVHHRHPEQWEFSFYGSREYLAMAYTDTFGCPPPATIWSSPLCCLAYSGAQCLGTTGSNPPNPPLPPTR